MSKHFIDIAVSIVEHGLIRKGVAQPNRVWHIDEKTGKRTLLVDNSEQFSEAQKSKNRESEIGQK